MMFNCRLLSITLLLLSAGSSVDAQTTPRYACGVDEAAIVPGKEYSVKVTNVVSEQHQLEESADPESAKPIKATTQLASYYDDPENVLLKSAEAVRAKLRSDRSKMPIRDPLLTKPIANENPENADEPRILDPAVRKKWTLIPAVKPIGSLWKLESAETNPTVRRTSYEEPMTSDSSALSMRRTKPKDRRMTSDELADYVPRTPGAKISLSVEQVTTIVDSKIELTAKRHKSHKIDNSVLTSFAV